MNLVCSLLANDHQLNRIPTSELTFNIYYTVGERERGKKYGGAERRIANLHNLHSLALEIY